MHACVHACVCVCVGRTGTILKCILINIHKILHVVKGHYRPCIVYWEKKKKERGRKGERERAAPIIKSLLYKYFHYHYYMFELRAVSVDADVMSVAGCWAGVKRLR